MFRCSNCGGQQEKGVSAHRTVVERRDVTYMDKAGKVIGRGWEIVKEVLLGPCCRGLFA